ncbi:MAG: methylated-DNA-[protein]-cysteine S-methyltransferase [Flavobacteriaceae bacterium]|jgi:methylated-DNA-[protein]-cysteine S-methyltransferase
MKMKMESDFTTYIESPLGVISLSFNSKFELTAAQFNDKEELPPAENSLEIGEIENTVKQFEEYFEGKRTQFDLRLAPEGTEFQKQVWKQLQEIQFGKTLTYQQMANQLGNPKVIRAAASANGRNPISIVIPCHRVIGSDGSLTGYAGGLHRKKWLLEHESPVKQQSLF